MSESKPLPSEARKDQAQAWFEALRDQICSAFERLEGQLEGVNAERLADVPPGRFTRSAWAREGGGGGLRRGPT